VSPTGLTASVRGSRLPGQSHINVEKLAENLNNATVISRVNLSPEAEEHLAAAEQSVVTSILELEISPVESWFEAKIENLETLFKVCDSVHLRAVCSCLQFLC
jgi:hypothetical protein